MSRAETNILSCRVRYLVSGFERAEPALSASIGEDRWL